MLTLYVTGEFCQNSNGKWDLYTHRFAAIPQCPFHLRKNVFVIFFSIVECSTFSSDVVLRMRVVKYNSSWGKRTTNCDIQVNSQINVSNTGNKKIIVRSRYTARCTAEKVAIRLPIFAWSFWPEYSHWIELYVSQIAVSDSQGCRNRRVFSASAK